MRHTIGMECGTPTCTLMCRYITSLILRRFWRQTLNCKHTQYRIKQRTKSDISEQEIPADARVTHDSTIIPSWLSAAILDIIEPEIAQFDLLTPKSCRGGLGVPPQTQAENSLLDCEVTIYYYFHSGRPSRPTTAVLSVALYSTLRL